MTVNWQEPIEAVHEDGRVERVEPTTLPSHNYMHYAGRVGAGKFAFAKDGYPLSALCPWRIRNVAEATQQPRTAPNGSNVVPEVLERMIVHLRGMAVQYDAGKREIDYAYAKDIVALLPEPVDPDLVEARKLANDYSCMEIDYVGGDGDQTSLVKIAVVAIKRGRQLERGGE